ncbi:MAG: TIGR00730 family Rossman fold protein [Spirochaetota bacterium]
MNICVFCSSSDTTPFIYKIAAEELGQQIASRNHHLIFGGSNVGLMREVAQSALQSGGKVTGVIPEYLRTKEQRFDKVDELIITESIYERKEIMTKRADAFVILPGGWGTMEEFFEVAAAKFRDNDQRPIGLLNTAGFYNQMFAFFNFLSHETFVTADWQDSFCVTEKVCDILDYIETNS